MIQIVLHLLQILFLMAQNDFPAILSELKKGQRAIISGFSGAEMPARFFEMGMLPGVELEMLFTAAFCDPLCISYGKARCCLALRKAEAQRVLIVPVPNEDDKSCPYRES